MNQIRARIIRSEAIREWNKIKPEYRAILNFKNFFRSMKRQYIRGE